ncbi:polysaccharide biosynthesis protein [Nitrospina sp. 32_T5]|uniref:polysaccharide biosynthesis protein n=1 Tax=unclassified Nitrospina TaxID=2638683 RepID=UPI003F977240
MRAFKKKFRKVILLGFDLTVCLMALYLAFLLRFEGSLPREQMEVFLDLAPIVLLCRAFSFALCRFYSRFWEYASWEDLQQILKAAAMGTALVLVFMFLYNRAHLVSRSVLFMDLILVVLMLGSSRLGWKLLTDRENQEAGIRGKGRVPILILGAGYTGAYLLKHLRRFSPHYSVRGFLDDDPKKLHHQVMGVKVLGGHKDLPELKESLGIQEVLVAVTSMDAERMEAVVKVCRDANVKYKTVSSFFDLVTHQPHISKIRNIEITDLLGREPVYLDLSMIQNMVGGKKIMVTGAGGSIGSELCRQLLEYDPAMLIMIDKCENYLYDLNMELNGEKTNAERKYFFLSVTQEKKLEALFQRFRPQLVFHAAAHKHVPLMEENADEAVLNNVQGTRITADLSERYGVEKFILVSTDKVVRPTSVMGMTKKIAERYIQYKAQRSQTDFMTVRFGNVLGSNGSVVPLFQKQIERGGPVTVTHPDMERFFMLIPEAVQLILQAGTIGRGGEILMLEMGRPVKLMDLAEKMIRLLGYTPGENMEIRITGVRPGEKLSEELVDDGEEVIDTLHKKIKRLCSGLAPGEGFADKVDALVADGARMEPGLYRQRLVDFIQEECTRTVTPSPFQNKP